jgi:sigma-B regulation protein RsbU (phosphoserine phosphatase)
MLVPIKHKSDVLAYLMLDPQESGKAEELDLDFVTALTNIIIVAVENKKLARRQQEQKDYKRQLEIAHNVQKLLFPNDLPYTSDLSIEASYLPHHEIGGDYYDYIRLGEESFLICIADVSGKGVPAAILMSNFQAGLRILAQAVKELDQIVPKLNGLIMDNVDTKSNRVQYINAGHNPPFLFCNNKMARLEKGTTILGGFPELPFLEVGEESYTNGFLFFGFTDGFTETYNEQGDEFGDDHLEQFLKENLSLDQHALHSDLINLLNSFKGKNRYADDITLVSCRVGQ